MAAEGGYEFHAGPIAHGPVAGFIVQQARVNGFTESGSFTSLSFGNQLLNSDVSLLGYQANLQWGMWRPFAQVVWDHDFASRNGVVNALLTTIAAPGFSLPAVVVGQDWATATAGTEIKFTPSLDRARFVLGTAWSVERYQCRRHPWSQLCIQSRAAAADRRQELMPVGAARAAFVIGGIAASTLNPLWRSRMGAHREAGRRKLSTTACCVTPPMTVGTIQPDLKLCDEADAARCSPSSCHIDCAIVPAAPARYHREPQRNHASRMQD